MSSPPNAQHLNAELLKQFCLEPTVELTAQAYKIWWTLAQQEAFTGDKLSTYPDVSILWDEPEYAAVKSQFKGKQIELKQNVLLSHLGPISGLKWVHSNSANRALGLRRSYSTMTLRSGTTGQILFDIDCSDLSAARTTFVPLKVFELRYSLTNMRVSLFCYGAGPVIKWLIRMLAHLHKDQVDKVFICTTPKVDTDPSSVTLAKELGKMPFDIIPVTDDAHLREADMVVTATDAYKNIVNNHKLAADATTVALSADEFSVAYIQDIKDRKGHLAAENIYKCFKRDYQALSRYYQDKAPTLDEQVALARLEGVMDLARVSPLDFDLTKSMHATGVGDPYARPCIRRTHLHALRRKEPKRLSCCPHEEGSTDLNGRLKLRGCIPAFGVG